MANTDHLIEGRDIVIIGLQPWYYEEGSNCKNIAFRLAEHNRILYVNRPLSRRTLVSGNKSEGVKKHIGIIKSKNEKIRKVSGNIWEYYPTCVMESVNWLPQGVVFDAVNYLNNKRFANDIRKAIQESGFKNIILLNDNDIYYGFYLKELLQPSLYVYYMRDFLQGFAYWKKHASVSEPMLIKKADVVVTNSVYFEEYCFSFNEHSFYIGQGCDLEIFDADKEFERPEELKEFTNPIIGYAGALNAERLDIGLIEKVAAANEDWNVVLVGQEDEAFLQSKLHELKNVYFLGRKDLKQLAGYINAFDVCINPQKVNEITQGNYPLKIDEYLALGKPVAAMKTQAMKLFEPVIYTAKNSEEFIASIEGALKENNNELRNKRIAFAREHTWESSINEFYKAVLKSGKINNTRSAAL